METSQGVAAERRALSGARILLAEDQPAMRQLLSRSLRAVGYEVVEACDGAALWSELSQTLDELRQLDLVISDIQMPGANGLEVLARLRQSDWSTPVILITAFGSEETKRDAGLLGAALVLNKPFKIGDLLLAVARVVNQA